MLENNLDVIRETQRFHFEDALNTRRGYYYPVEKFARGRAESLWARAQRLFAPLVEILRVPRPSLERRECAYAMIGC